MEVDQKASVASDLAIGDSAEPSQAHSEGNEQARPPVKESGTDLTERVLPKLETIQSEFTARSELSEPTKKEKLDTPASFEKSAKDELPKVDFEGTAVFQDVHFEVYPGDKPWLQRDIVQGYLRNGNDKTVTAWVARIAQNDGDGGLEFRVRTENANQFKSKIEFEIKQGIADLVDSLRAAGYKGNNGQEYDSANTDAHAYANWAVGAAIDGLNSNGKVPSSLTNINEKYIELAAAKPPEFIGNLGIRTGDSLSDISKIAAQKTEQFGGPVEVLHKDDYKFGVLPGDSPAEIVRKFYKEKVAFEGKQAQLMASLPEIAKGGEAGMMKWLSDIRADPGTKWNRELIIDSLYKFAENQGYDLSVGSEASTKSALARNAIRGIINTLKTSTSIYASDWPAELAGIERKYNALPAEKTSVQTSEQDAAAKIQSAAQSELDVSTENALASSSADEGKTISDNIENFATNAMRIANETGKSFTAFFNGVPIEVYPEVLYGTSGQIVEDYLRNGNDRTVTEWVATLVKNEGDGALEARLKAQGASEEQIEDARMDLSFNLRAAGYESNYGQAYDPSNKDAHVYAKWAVGVIIDALNSDDKISSSLKDMDKKYAELAAAEPPFFIGNLGVASGDNIDSTSKRAIEKAQRFGGAIEFRFNLFKLTARPDGSLEMREAPLPARLVANEDRRVRTNKDLVQLGVRESTIPSGADSGSATSTEIAKALGSAEGSRALFERALDPDSKQLLRQLSELNLDSKERQHVMDFLRSPKVVAGTLGGAALLGAVITYVQTHRAARRTTVDRNLQFAP